MNAKMSGSVLPVAEANDNPLRWGSSAAFLRLAVVCMLAGSGAYGIAVVAFAPGQASRILAVLLLASVAVVAAYFLLRERVGAVVRTLSLGVWASVTFISFFFGGVGGTLIIIYPLTILLTGWLIGTRMAVLLTALTVLTTFAFTLCELAGVLPVAPPTSPVLRWVVQCFVFVLSAALITHAVRSYRQRLDEVQRLGAELAQRSAELQAREADLNRAQAVSQVGSWVYDLVNDRMVLSDETCRIFGVAPGSTGDYTTYRSHVHPPDRKSVDRAWRAAIEGQGVFDNEHRIRCGKVVRWVRQRAEFEFDSTGRAVRSVGTTQDVTDRRRKAALTELLEALARATNEAPTPELAMRACLERIYSYGNWALGHVAIFEPGQFRGEPPVSFWRSDDMQRFKAFISYSDRFSYSAPTGRFVGAAVRDRRAVWVEDFGKLEGRGRAAVAAGFGLRAGLAFPVFAGGEVAGFLEFFARSARPPDELLLEAVHTITGQLSRLIERRRGETELERRVIQRTAELEAANRELNSFSYAIAHDMRAPVRAINGFSEIVLRANEGRLDEASVGYLRRIVAGSRHMGYLIDDLLKLARLSRQEMRRQPVDLSAMASSVAAEIALAQPQRRVPVEVRPGMTVEADATLMRAVLDNLIGNACKPRGRRRRTLRSASRKAMARWRISYVTTVSVSTCATPTSCSCPSSGCITPTSLKAPASDSPPSSASSTVTAAVSGSTANRAAAPRCSSRCPLATEAPCRGCAGDGHRLALGHRTAHSPTKQKGGVNERIRGSQEEHSLQSHPPRPCDAGAWRTGRGRCRGGGRCARLSVATGTHAGHGVAGQRGRHPRAIGRAKADRELEATNRHRQSAERGRYHRFANPRRSGA